MRVQELGMGLRPDDDNAIYVPLHKACLQIVKGVIAFRLKEPNKQYSRTRRNVYARLAHGPGFSWGG